jgi:tRNA-specific 2-thiouridylase
LQATQANWHRDLPAEFEATVQVRYNHAGSPGRVRLTGSAGFEVDFAEPVMAVTPGQAAVCYQGDRLLGGGWIQSAW